MSICLLRIVVNEQQHEKREQTSKTILSYLWQQGVPGATMRRGDAGLDESGYIYYNILEDTYFNNLPIIIESVIDTLIINRIEGGIKTLVKHGQISIVKGIDNVDISEHDFFVVKVYTSENKKKLLDKDEYEKILTFLQKKKAIWATVTKGISGYGRDHKIYNQHLFSTSEHMPLVVECIVGKDNLSYLLDELKSVVTDGIVFTAPVDVILNR